MRRARGGRHTQRPLTGTLDGQPALGLAGLAAAIYVGIVGRRMRRQKAYHVVLEDWAWHVVFPLVAYLAFVVAAPVLLGTPVLVLFVIGAAQMLLLFIGIHNALDTMTYVAFSRTQVVRKHQAQ